MEPVTEHVGHLVWKKIVVHRSNNNFTCRDRRTDDIWERLTIKFWLLYTLSQLQVWSGKVSVYWANLIILGTSSLWNRVIVFQRDGILSTGYFADLTIVFTKLRWQKQSTHVLKKYQFMLWLHFGLHNFFLQNLTQERDLKY